MSHTDYFASCTSGGLTGILFSLLSRRGIRSVFQTSFTGLIAGIGAQYLYNSFELWRKHKAIEINYPDLFEKKEKAKWTLDRFQTWWLGFWHRQSRAVRIEEDLMLLQEAIKDENRRIDELDKLLSVYGVEEETDKREGEMTGDDERTMDYVPSSFQSGLR